MTNFFEFNRGADASRLQAEIIASGLESVYEYVHVKSPSLTRIATTDSITPQQESTLSGVVDVHIEELTEATPLQWWNQIGDQQTNYDYKFIRTKIAKETIASGWNQLPYLEKQIAARWFVVDATQRTEVYTIDEQVALGARFHRCSVDARSARFKATTIEIYNRLTRSEQMTIMARAEQSALPHLYAQYGIEGTLEGDSPGLFDYILGRENTPWAGSGILQQNFQPSGMTMTQLVDKMMNILASGLYDYAQFTN